MTKGPLLYFADGAPPALTTHTRFDFLGALRGHAKFPLITFSSLEDQAAPQNSFIFTKCVDSIPTAPTNQPFSQQQLGDLSRRQIAAIRASRVAPMAPG